MSGLIGSTILSGQLESSSQAEVDVSLCRLWLKNVQRGMQRDGRNGFNRIISSNWLQVKKLPEGEYFQAL